MNFFIEARNIGLIFKSKDRAPVTALSNFNLEVSRGEFVSIVGPSGCGKSTFLNMLLGLIKPGAGEMRIDGTPITGPGQERAMVFQEFGLLPWRTVQANVELGLELKGVPAAQRAARGRDLINLVGLNGFERHYPHELSGGMKQRVGLARALATDPEVLLMDEPFAALDAQTRDLMQMELLQIWERTNKTVLFVTHSIEEAAYLSDRVIVMTARPGRTKNIVKIDLPRPRDYEMRLTPEFNEIKSRIWEVLKEELTSRG
ncbi:MAG TPA: ABC transporter ATP-binding protein [Candidatus Binatia bacterium]|nr:ABC transporter ATP-binding protein [Candidatus Binatia bacterium]